MDKREVKDKAGNYLCSMSSISDFCGAVHIYDLRLMIKGIANTLLDMSEDTNEDIWTEEGPLPVIFFDVEDGRGWRWAESKGISPVQTWINPNTGNEVGIFYLSVEDLESIANSED